VIRDAVSLGFRGVLLMEHYGGDSLGVCATNARYVRSVLPAPATDPTRPLSAPRSTTNLETS
jgi:hypothetical protein